MIINGKKIFSRKCAIIGCGIVGELVSTLLAKESLFSEIALLDQNPASAERIAVNLAQALPFLPPINVYAGDYGDLADCSVIIITEVGKIDDFTCAVSKIKCVGASAILLIAADNSELLASLAVTVCSYPAERVLGIGTFTLAARMELMISNHTGVCRGNVSAFVAGIADGDAVALLSCASIYGVNALQYGARDASLSRTFFEDIMRDPPSPLATALASCELARLVCREGESVASVAVMSGGAYGTDDVCISLPAVIGRCGVKRILELPISAREEEKLCLGSTKLFKKICDLT